MTPGQPAPTPQVPGQEPKKESAEKPALPADVAKWKKRRLLPCPKTEQSQTRAGGGVYLGQTSGGSEPAAQGLTELLKPLPAEKPATATRLSGGAAPARPCADRVRPPRNGRAT